MELMLLIPLTLVLGGLAVYLALAERRLPLPAPAGFTSFDARPLLPAAGQKGAPAALAATAAARTGPGSLTATSFTQTDVLLADALTEMIGLKAEMYRLHEKVESLNAEVARLSGRPTPPTPPAVFLRKAA